MAKKTQIYLQLLQSYQKEQPLENTLDKRKEEVIPHYFELQDKKKRNQE